MKQDQKIILFDGVCKLCNFSVDFIVKRTSASEFKMISLQSYEGQKILNQFGLQQEINSVLLIQNDQVYVESDAVLEICKHLRAPWNWLRAFKILPKNFRDILYRWIANNRYKWFGKRKTCRVI
ncbi:DCC1-like thiol-disulfide oxidoreductase family protein [Draconibacterium sp. IB214405]|uniref:thiol-disulfide oxidoreductase DCC family protein n=1 Tax=Draconibacterium sp. IB214405 TaxID=3097352 RepID=UPI002A11957D|nr:DCC1-like thiol-disulfide oxidoreductase family protein [Draconibacterium sp. IB214405]MDX8341013.1 DCC1-like thiol-disulfide oxidoreductase family protein [Draconibacterium sp. IB214405]